MFFGKIFRAIGRLFKKVGSGIKKGFQAIGRALKSKKFWIIVGIAAAIFITGAIASGGVTQFLAVLKTIPGTLGNAMKAVGVKVKGGLQAIGGKLGVGGSGAGGVSEINLRAIQSNALSNIHGLNPIAKEATQTGIGATLKGLFSNPLVQATVVGQGIQGLGQGLMAHGARSGAKRQEENLKEYASNQEPVKMIDWSNFWREPTEASNVAPAKETASPAAPAAPATQAPPSTMVPHSTARRTVAPPAPRPKASLLGVTADEILQGQRRTANGIA